ncbi:hypothetical protein B0H14DRAFT_2197346, partial [Mycena olivaceomarginata]
YYAPDMFDGFRFSSLRNTDNDQHRVFPFGHDKHACPGSIFFAVTELKAMLAHVILNYDVKLD